MKHAVQILSVLSLLAAGLVMAPASAATFSFPGVAPCDATLQACIDGVPSGSTIELATNGPIVVSSDIVIEDKSLTLRPKSGFQPVLQGSIPGDPRSLRLEVIGPAEDVSVRVTGLRMTEMNVRIYSQGVESSNHSFLLSNSRVSNTEEHNNTPGIAVDQRSPSEAILRNNTVTTNGQQIQVWHGSDLGPTHALIEGNRTESVDTEYAYTGIETRADGSSLATTDLFNNVVHDAAGCNCGGPGGITTFTPVGANAVFNIVGNTIHEVDADYPGIEVRAAQPSTQQVRIFNNSISDATGGAFWFPPAAPGLKIQNAYNNIFNSPKVSDLGYPIGPHTSRLNPRYKNAGNANFRLKSSSPLINRGATCQTGGLGRADAGGHFRLNGPNVDIGAYEFGSTKKPPAGSNFFGTNKRNVFAGTGGVDIMCGFGGRDKLNGRGGPDHLFGGTGGDRLLGRAGTDRLYAGKGKQDVLSGGAKADLLVTKDGRGGDVARGGTGNDTCRTDRRDRRRSC